MLIFQDLSFLQLFLWITVGLFLLSLGRIVSLGRQNRQLFTDHAKMENWATAQHAELTGMHHDAQSWRAKTQRQFDSARADLGARLEQAERGCAHAFKEVEAAQENALATAMTKIHDLEKKLAEALEAPAASEAAMPALPAMETLRAESLQTELTTVMAEAAEQRHQNGELQRALLLARRKHAPAARRHGMRMPRP